MKHKDNKVCEESPPGKPAVWWITQRCRNNTEQYFFDMMLPPVIAKTAAEACGKLGITLAQTSKVRFDLIEEVQPEIPVDRYASIRCVEEDDE